MKTRLLFLAIALALLPAWRSAVAQVTAKTLDSIQEIQPDGSVNLTIQLSFDAKPWQLWKTIVGDNPARLRSMMRYQFAALVIDDFKFEKDDLNRTAKITIRSPAGPELRKDQRLEIPVDQWCRMINHTGREWFFSGNNPAAGDQQTSLKVVLPANTIEASLVNAGTPNQTLVYALSVPAGKSRVLVWIGAVILLLGAVLLVAGMRSKEGAAPAAIPAPPPPAA